jgi:hypothetical protein
MDLALSVPPAVFARQSPAVAHNASAAVTARASDPAYLGVDRSQRLDARRKEIAVPSMRPSSFLRRAKDLPRLVHRPVTSGSNRASG